METELHKPFSSDKLRFEYGLDGIRLLPWAGLNVPFAGAYCIVRPKSSSVDHVNSPYDEEELFICISGVAEVIIGERAFAARQGDVFFMPARTSHWVRNESDEPFHFYALWWNQKTAREFLKEAECQISSEYSI